MNRETLPISQIIVEDRQRIDLGDIDALSSSLTQYGLIQPIVVSQEKRLIAGGRRLAAARRLGWESIDVVFKETLTTDYLHELELEENVRRHNFSWQEECLTIATIHQKKIARNALEGKAWGQRQTAELFGGMSVGSVNYALKVAHLLKHELALPDPSSRRAWQCTSAADAYRNVILRDEQDRLQAELARRAQEEANKRVVETEKIVEEFKIELSTSPVEGSVSDSEREHFNALRDRAKENYLLLNENEARSLYLYNKVNPPEKFEEYYKQKRELLTQHLTLEVTKNFILGDSIAHMLLEENKERYDHIITDIPYGIDMDMLDQQNQGMVDIDTVAKEHDVDSNMDLMSRFFRAAYVCTKPTAFVITWADIMQWQYMYDLAIAAGFRVQRWPITWHKTHQCMNQSAQYNFTKSTEIAIVCRKPNAVMVQPASTCVISASNVEARRQFDHPFAKPSEIWNFLLDHVSIKGQTILEPFAGRGSGVVAMLRAERKVVGIEINETHYNALLENVKKHYLTLNPNFVFV